jgi:hypothetical protein
MALAVVAGGMSLDEALKKMADRLKEDADPAARIEALRARYSDLATQVTEDGIYLINSRLLLEY